jgi:peroxiredoxin
MNALNAASTDWPKIEPLLDEAMHALEDSDRAAVLLRYFENKSLRAVGQALGTSEDAAQKRVSRAVERLREFFARRGVTVGASALAFAISANAVHAAPVGLTAAISTAAALAALSIPSSAGAGATAGFFGALFQVSRTKLVAGLAAMAILGLIAFMLFRAQERAGAGAVTAARSPNAPGNPQADTAGLQDVNAAEGQREPNPLKLLQAVARARQRIASGSLELRLSIEHFGSPRSETNHLRLAALFDGPKLRYEQFGREYSYSYSADEAEANEIRIRADSMDREAAVRAGLLKPFESHHAVAYDGAVLLNYWETDGKPSGTTIDDPSKGTSAVIFDPRCLGLRAFLSMGSTVEDCLGYHEAQSIDLVGEELVEEISAWHVRVQSKHGESLDFWIEVAHPERLLKHARGRDLAVSQYDAANSRDPIPTEVTTIEFRDGSPLFVRRFIRSNSHFNVSIDPASFALAGLGMAVGTPVSDIRIQRQIGYWTGAGLSENLPPKKEADSQSPPNLAELLVLLESDPASPEALNAAAWILLNTHDGPEVEKAAEVILREHTRNINLVYLCIELERLRHRCSKPLLEAMVKDNPSAEVRGTACFALAILLKDEAKYGQNKKAMAEAEKLFERVIAEFGQVKQRGWNLKELARPELSELRHLTLGKPAPEIEGEDLDGQPMKLSDFRGKVVVLIFWTASTASYASEQFKLVEQITGKAFAFLGVNCDSDPAKAKAAVEKNRITWPSFRDGQKGPISTTWNVRGWPNIWVLDRHGVIRYRDLRGRDLKEAVNKLLRD